MHIARLFSGDNSRNPAFNQTSKPDRFQESTLANTAQARKRAKQAEKRRRHNASFRSMVRTYIKKVVTAIETKDYDKATAAYNEAVPVIDRMADKGIIHKNKASRHKSRLNDSIKALRA
jgi:small subunit ribosomal protein S20